MYVGITGTIGAGKGEAVRILRTFGFTHYGFGEFLRKRLREEGTALTVENQKRLADALRTQHGHGTIAELLLRQCEADAPRHAVFESIRHPAELAVLKRLPGFILLSIDAPRETRYERVTARGRGDGLDTPESFAAAEDAQLEGTGANGQIRAVMDQADITIVNIGNLEELEATIRDELDL